jgi:hypothetical protein
VRLSPLGTAATTGLLYQPQMIDDSDCGAIGVMKIGRGNRSTWRKPAPVPLCLPQIPHDQTRAWTWAAVVGSQWLTTCAMMQPTAISYILAGKQLDWWPLKQHQFPSFFLIHSLALKWDVWQTLLVHSPSCLILPSHPRGTLLSTHSDVHTTWPTGKT